MFLHVFTWSAWACTGPARVFSGDSSKIGFFPREIDEMFFVCCSRKRLLKIPFCWFFFETAPTSPGRGRDAKSTGIAPWIREVNSGFPMFPFKGSRCRHQETWRQVHHLVEELHEFFQSWHIHSNSLEDHDWTQYALVVWSFVVSNIFSVIPPNRTRNGHHGPKTLQFFNGDDLLFEDVWRRHLTNCK